MSSVPSYSSVGIGISRIPSASVAIAASDASDSLPASPDTSVEAPLFSGLLTSFPISQPANARTIENVRRKAIIFFIFSLSLCVA